MKYPFSFNRTIYVKNCSLIKLGGFYFCERLNSADSKIDILENRKRRIEYDVPNGLYIGLEYDMWFDKKIYINNK